MVRQRLPANQQNVPAVTLHTSLQFVRNVSAHRRNDRLGAAEGRFERIFLAGSDIQQRNLKDCFSTSWYMATNRLPRRDSTRQCPTFMEQFFWRYRLPGDAERACGAVLRHLPWPVLRHLPWPVLRHAKRNFFVRQRWLFDTPAPQPVAGRRHLPKRCFGSGCARSEATRTPALFAGIDAVPCASAPRPTGVETRVPSCFPRVSHQVAGRAITPRKVMVRFQMGFSMSSRARSGKRLNNTFKASAASSRASCAPRQ